MSFFDSSRGFLSKSPESYSGTLLSDSGKTTRLSASGLEYTEKQGEIPETGYRCGMSMEYDIPIVEILELWFSAKNRKYAACCSSEDGVEFVIWMTFRQFASFLQQCRMHGREGIYAHYSGARFLFTVFGGSVSGCDYRLALHFDLFRNQLLRPIPPKLEIPNNVEIDDGLRDKYRN